MELRTACVNPNCPAIVRTPLGDPAPAAASCPACGSGRPLRVDAALVRDGRLELCPACDGREFFVRKDFPQKLGLAIVVAAALISCIFLYQKNLVGVWAVLGGAVLIDAALYFVTGRVVVCYRCRAEFRGLPYNPAIKPFDLATSEKYAEVH
jgi:uncharacterized protein (DUF983 family)